MLSHNIFHISETVHVLQKSGILTLPVRFVPVDLHSEWFHLHPAVYSLCLGTWKYPVNNFFFKNQYFQYLRNSCYRLDASIVYNCLQTGWTAVVKKKSNRGLFISFVYVIRNCDKRKHTLLQKAIMSCKILRTNICLNS